MRAKMRFLLVLLGCATLFSCARTTPSGPTDYLRVPGQDAKPPDSASQPSDQVAQHALDSYFEALQNHDWNTAWSWRARSDPNTLCARMIGLETYDEFEANIESAIDELGELISWEYDELFWDYQSRSGGGFYQVKYRVFRNWSSGYRQLVYGELAPSQGALDTFRICWMKEGSY